MLGVPTSGHLHHLHHHHQRSNNIEVRNDLPSLAQHDGAGSTTTQMPSLTSASAASPTPTPTQSYSYDLSVPAGNVGSPGSLLNPFIYDSKMPSNFVFIVVGAILGLILLVSIAYNLSVKILANLKAKSDKEIYYARMVNVDFSDRSSNSSILQSFSSSNSSVLEKKPQSSNSSVYLLQKQNSMLQLQQMEETTKTSQQGRTYRDTAGGQRNSLYFSPVMDMITGKRNSQLELPLYHSSTSILTPLYKEQDSPLPSEYSCGDGFMHDTSFDINSYSISQESQPVAQERPPMKRPPSQYLEDLLNEKS